MKFVGIDIETTGLDPNQNHRLIQIGIAFGVLDSFGYDVKPEGAMALCPAAMEINHFTPERIEGAEGQSQVDAIIHNKLLERGCSKGELTPVGWNVGAFDMKFISKELPKTAEFFSHRVLDLTPICIYKSFLSGYDTAEAWRAMKETEHKRIESLLGEAKWHDAEYDATAALLQWRLWSRS